jgi:protein-disulfide isomerase/uncharacterized membrane protein
MRTETSNDRSSDAPCVPCASPRLYIAIAVLCLAGIGVSIELTRIHLMTHTDPEFHSICAVSEGVNCETVALSAFSVFAGLPVSVWGIVGYSAMLLLALWGAIGPRLHPRWPCGLLMTLFTLALLVAAFLGYISATRIDSLCLFCMSSYAISLALFALGIAAIRKSRCGPLRALGADMRALLSRPWLIAVGVLVGGGGVWITQAAVDPYWQTVGWTDLPELPRGRDSDGFHWTGAEDPELTIVEFSDYECPHCRKAHKNIRMLAAEYPKRVKLVHRHLPLDRSCHPLMRRPFHQRSCEFAKAAECAGEQGSFWKMNDALFSIQDHVKSKDIDLVELAVRLGIGRSEFKKCMASDRAMKRVEKDLDAAIEKRLRGTPTFFIGSEKFMGRIPKKELVERLGEPPASSAGSEE